MKKTILPLVAACLGCCALAFLLPGVVGASLFGASLFKLGISVETVLCALPLAVLAGYAVYAVARRRRRPCPPERGCKANGDCGCKP